MLDPKAAAARDSIKGRASVMPNMSNGDLAGL